MSTPTLLYTPIEDIPKIHARARRAFLSGKARSVAFRREQIRQVGYMLKENEQRFKDALKLDLGRPELESQFIDLSPPYIEIRDAYDSIKSWTRTRRAKLNLSFLPFGPKIHPEPKGVVLVIAPYNGPLTEIMSPLVGGIAAGNAVVIKPSEQIPATSALVSELIPKYLDNDLYHVVNGSVPETTKILELQWDHICYIGSGRVGRIVAAAAAKHLTPLTLELGGKSPVVVDPNTDLRLAAKRILWGRFLNAGQICVAPDYVLIPEHIQDKFVEIAKEVYHSFYPEGPKESASLSRIVNEAHTERIKSLLDNTAGSIVLGGDIDVEKRYVAPTVVRDVKGDDSLMSEEIFGPVLPLVPVKDVDEAITFIKARDHPLVVYVFSQDKKFQRKVYENTQSGGVVYNETMISAGVPGLPMGGVGPSGYGYYSGKFMFDEFTHQRITLDSPSWIDSLGFGCRYPPYKSLKPMQRFLPSPPSRAKARA